LISDNRQPTTDNRKLLVGIAARLLGVVPAVLFGGFMTLVVVVLMAWKSPQLRRLKGAP